MWMRCNTHVTQQQTKDSLNKGLINVMCHIRRVRIVYISDFCPTCAACLIRQRLFLFSFPPFLTGPLEFHLWCDELWVKAASCANIELLQPAPFSPGSPRIAAHTRLLNLKAARANCQRFFFLGGGCSQPLESSKVWGNGLFFPWDYTQWIIYKCTCIIICLPSLDIIVGDI